MKKKFGVLLEKDIYTIAHFWNPFILIKLFLLDCVIKKTPCLPIVSEDFDKSWRNALRESELKLMNALTEEHAVSYLDWARTFHKEMDFLQNVCDRNDFNKWLSKLNVIIEKLDIRLKRQKIKKYLKNGTVWLFKEVCPGTIWRMSNLFLF